MPPVFFPLRLVAAAAFVWLASGCVRPPDMSVRPATPECRHTIAADGSASDTPIEWIAPVGARDRDALAAWCDSVGPAVFAEAGSKVGPDPTLVGSDPTSAGPTLAVVSWNVHAGGGRLDELVADLRAGRLTGGAPVPHFVLLVQEAFRDGSVIPAAVPSGLRVPDRIGGPAASPERASRIARRSDITDMARTLGLALLYVPSMRNGAGDTSDREDRGNAILSTLPLSAPAAVELPFEVQRRVAAAATVQGVSADGRPWSLRVASAHLDVRAGARHLWIAGGFARARQAHALRDALDGESPVVLGADLNTWEGPAERAYQLLRQAFPRTPPPDRRRTFGRFLRLDYLFFRIPDLWRVSYEILDEAYGSDHRPLVGRLTIPPRLPARPESLRAVP